MKIIQIVLITQILEENHYSYNKLNKSYIKNKIGLISFILFVFNKNKKYKIFKKWVLCLTYSK